MADKGQAGDEGTMTATSWRAAAIAFAVTTLVLGAFAIIWISEASTDEGKLIRVQIVGAGMAVGLAIVTFCTVIWRGMISAAQADLQRMQIDKLAQQIAATEENNLAVALQKGAELLADEKTARVAAGIATLEFIATAANPRFAEQAMNLLADFIQERFVGDHDGVLFDAASSALWSGSQLGRKSNRYLHFWSKDDEAEWFPICGVTHCEYSGGHISFNVDEETFGQTSVAFRGVRFQGSKIAVLAPRMFGGCEFDSCTIEGVAGSGVFGEHANNTFQHCNFSDAEFRLTDPDDLREGGNYYVKGHPPRGIYPQANWTDFLLEQEIPF